MAARWQFGWNIVAAALMTLLSSGMRLSFGPFFLPMANDLVFSRSLLSSIVAAGMLASGLAMPLAGLLIARFATPPVLLAGNALVIAAVWRTVTTGDAVELLVAFGLMLSMGIAFTSPVALTPVIGHWFTAPPRHGTLVPVDGLDGRHRGDDAGSQHCDPSFRLAPDAEGVRRSLHCSRCPPRCSPSRASQGSTTRCGSASHRVVE